MKKQFINITLIALLLSTLTNCSFKTPDDPGQPAGEALASVPGYGEGESHRKKEMGAVHLSELQFNNLNMKLDSLSTRVLAGVVEANGRLEVPPQHEATVTAIIGANVASIKVIEGDRVRKGQPLAYLTHPSFTQLQMEYVKAYHRLQFLEKESDRQKRLYEEEVGSGKELQQIQAEFESMKAEVKGYEVRLRQLNMNAEKVKNGDIYEYIPVPSPIDGYIEKVLVQLGQFVDPQKELFTIVNTEHIHADLMVFEKDIHKVKKDQKLSFTVESAPGETLYATIFSVGKQFEQNPKAVHVHAEIDKKKGFLIPGMYIHGKIQTEDNAVHALPEEAVVKEADKSYIFTAKKHRTEDREEWEFTPVEVRTGLRNDGWVEIKPMEALLPGTQIAWNEAYYLISEMKKSQTSHSH